MIYRHYKGGLYLLEGYATPFSDSFYDKDGTRTTIEVIARAKYEANLEEVDVVIVFDKEVKSTYYAYHSDELKGVMCFYRGLDGQYWLRAREDFYKDLDVKDGNGNIVTTIPRFKKMKREELFDMIAYLDAILKESKQ